MRLSPLGRRRNRPAVDLCVVGRPRGAVRIFRRLQQAAYRSGQRVGRQRNIPLAERLADRIRDRAELPERYSLAQADVEKSGPFHILDLCGAPIDMRRGRSGLTLFEATTGNGASAGICGQSYRSENFGTNPFPSKEPMSAARSLPTSTAIAYRPGALAGYLPRCRHKIIMSGRRCMMASCVAAAHR